MSNSISTFIMQGPDVIQEERGQDTTPNTTSYSTFLPQATPTAPTFLTGTPDTFLTLPEQMEGEGEGLLGSGDGEGVSQGSLLYLDPTSALHVLVHHLPQASHQPTPPQLVEEEGSQEQFVVVGALKNGEELASPPTPATCHVSVESILEEELAGGRGEIYLPQPQEPTPTPQHLPATPVLTLMGGGNGGDTNDGTAGITLDSVPHITLEEIIQKFASSPDSPVDALDDPSTTTTTITAITPHQEPPPPLPPPPSLPPAPSVSPRVKVKLLQEVTKESEAGGVLGEEWEGDDECLYDVVVTYRCRVCGEVYEDKESLRRHHYQQHRQTHGGVVKIKVTTSTTHPPRGSPIGLDKEQSEVNVHSCGFCYKDFLGLRELQDHISKEHPAKRMKEGGSRRHQSHGSQVKYPPQPGMLIGHRKPHTPAEGIAGQTAGVGGGEGGVEGKRKVREPRALQEQFWLQKQRPKPVCSVEVEKTHRCPVSTCKYKFSSEANLQAHQDCHAGGRGRGGGKGEERGFTCPHCYFRSDKWSVCQLHLWKNHGLDIDLLTCGICHTYKTCTQQRLVVHQKIHSEARDHVCQTCGKGFKQLAQMLNHQVSHITDPKDLPAWKERRYCEECQKWLKDRKALKLHITLVHLKYKPHSCPHCPYRCARTFDLRVHMRQHTGERPHRCPLCGWQARDHNAMRRHKLGHQDMKPFHCPEPLCGFKTRHPTYFKRHMNRRHPKNEAVFKCQFCPLETAILQDYISHSMKHEKDLTEQAMKRGALADEDPPVDTGKAATGEGSVSTAPVTTTNTITTTTDTSNTLPNPIVLNKMEVITIKFDDPGGAAGTTREDAKPGGDAAVAEAETEAVSLPQVVVSENSGHYIIGLPPDFTPSMTENNRECHIGPNTHPQQHHNNTITTSTLHHTASHPHLHSASSQDCNATT